MAITLSSVEKHDAGDQYKVTALATFAGNYATHGVAITAAQLGLNYIEDMSVEDSEGLTFDVDIAAGGASALVKAYRVPAVTGTIVSTVTPHADSAGTPAGTITGKLDLAVPSFSGTGFATAGQVITTTDNQTMPAVTSAAGMWFIADALPASPPVLILSNTIVAGAPAVLTCQGVPPVTDAGTYKIVTLGAATFTGTPMGTHSHASTVASVLTGAVTGSLTEYTNGVAIAVAVNVEAFGR